MFCNKPKNINRTVPGKKNKKRKKKATHIQTDNKLKKTNQSHLNIAHAMSSWAQNYTAATTWQLKHQIAYWKSRAVALQYENKILHEMIRDQLFKQAATSNEVASAALASDELENQGEDEEENEYEDENVDENDGNDDFEVSEEFIEFLKQNAKHKEDARRERERLQAKHEADEAEAQNETFESSDEKQARLKELYGDNWQRVLALETSLLCTFISECDKEPHEYWPNIPFNFSSC